MLRLVGFFVLAVILARVLGHVPVIGPVFARTGCLGIWVAAMLLSWAFTRGGERLVRMQRDGAEIRRLSTVQSPYNSGKLGSLYLAQGRAKRALEPLRHATAGEPESAEWHYRLAQALVRTGDRDGALAEFDACLAIDAEHAYGAAQMGRARLLADLRRPAEALESLLTFERNHGPSPESAYRRGQAQRALGDAGEAQAAFAEVSSLAAHVAPYQRAEASLWSLRARLGGRL